MNRRTIKRLGRIGAVLALMGQWFVGLPPAHAGLAALDAFHVGRYHLANGERDKALEAFNDAVRMNPQFVQAYIARGKLLAEMGNFDSALADLSFALRLQPTHAEGFAYRGFALLSLGKPQEAVPEFDMALRIDPSYARVYLLRGQALAVLGDTAGSEAGIAMARRLDPTIETTQVVTAGADGSMQEGVTLASGSNMPVRGSTTSVPPAPTTAAPAPQGWGDRTVRFEDHPLLGQLHVPHNARPRQPPHAQAQVAPRNHAQARHLAPRRQPSTSPIRHLPDLTSEPEPSAATNDPGAAAGKSGATADAAQPDANAPAATASTPAADLATGAGSVVEPPMAVTLSPKTIVDLAPSADISPSGVMPSATPSSSPPGVAGAAVESGKLAETKPSVEPEPSKPEVKTIVAAPPIVVEDHAPKMPAAGEILDGRIGDLIGSPPKPHPQQSLNNVQSALEQARARLTPPGPSAAHVSDDGSTSPTQAPPSVAPGVDPAVAAEAEAAYRRGLECEERDELDGALAAYSEAVRLNAHHASALCRRGHLLCETFRTAEALADFDSAVRAAPGLSTGYFGRAHVLYVTDRCEDAVDDYTIALRLDDQHAQAWIERGHCHARLGRMEQAAADRRAALDLDPSLAKTGPKYAMETKSGSRPTMTAVVVSDGDDSETTPTVAAIPVGPSPAAPTSQRPTVAAAPKPAGSGSAFGNLFAPKTDARGESSPVVVAPAESSGPLARLAPPVVATPPVASPTETPVVTDEPKRLTVDDRAAAIATLGAGLAQSPGDADLYFRRASLLVEQLAFEEALDDLNAAVRLNPDFADALALRGMAHVQVERYPAAQADFTELSRLLPNDPAVYSERGYVRLCLGLKDEAIADFTRALELDGTRGDVYCQRALAFALSGNPKRAMADFDEALRRRPGDAETYLCRGKAYAEFGQAADAMADFDCAIRLDPNKAEAYFERSRLLAERGAHERATADRRRALQLDPTLR